MEKRSFKVVLFICLGWLFVGLAFLGVLLPLVPTIPFLLLASYFFSKSSNRYHDWLMQHKIFGPFLKNYLEHKGIERKSRFRILLFLWIGLVFSMLFTPFTWLILPLLSIGLGVTYHLYSLKTIELERNLGVVQVSRIKAGSD